MPYLPLPSRPDLDQLKKQARELLDAARQGDVQALQRFGEHHPRFADMQNRDVRLADAQLVLARQYGQPSWRQLKDEVELRRLDAQQRVDRFVRAATHEASGNADSGIRIAKRLLQLDDSLRQANLWTALAFGDLARVQSELGNDPTRINESGGPWKNRTPLHYVTFSKLGQDDPAIRQGLLDTATWLLDQGADPDASFTVDDPPEHPLRSLYGACGVTNFPEMAKLLLDRGANINDNESLYHSMEHDDTEILELLIARGAEPTGTNALNHSFDREGTHRTAMLLEHGADPNEVFQDHGTPLHVAVSKGRDRSILSLLIQHGADINARRRDGRTPYQVALQHANDDAARYLESLGADTTATPFEKFCAACGRGDLEAAQQLRADNPSMFDQRSDAERRILHNFAVAGQADAIDTMLRAGIPSSELGVDGETPLHNAAWHGWVDVVRVLLEHKAALEVVETTYGCTPLGWAAHGSDNWPNPKGDYAAVVRLLLDAGADITPRNKWNESIVSLAGSQDEIAEILRDAEIKAGIDTLTPGADNTKPAG